MSAVLRMAVPAQVPMRAAQPCPYQGTLVRASVSASCLSTKLSRVLQPDPSLPLRLCTQTVMQPCFPPPGYTGFATWPWYLLGHHQGFGFGGSREQARTAGGESPVSMPHPLPRLRLKAWSWAAPAGKLTLQEGGTHHDEGGVTETLCDPGGHLLCHLVWAVEKDL